MDGWDTCVSREDSPGGINSTTPVAGPAPSATEWWSPTGSRCCSSRGGTATARIARAVFSLEGGGPYALDIPASPVFLVSVPVEDTVPTEPVSIEDITFYDSQGREITEEFDLSGGAIQ